MLDDTCYFVPCDSAEQAAVLGALLTHETCVSFVRSLTFQDSKRPITKRTLQRLNLARLLERVDRLELIAAANDKLHILGGPPLPPEYLDYFSWPGAETPQILMFR